MLFDSGEARRKQRYLKALELAKELPKDPLEAISLLEMLLIAQWLSLGDYGPTPPGL